MFSYLTTFLSMDFWKKFHRSTNTDFKLLLYTNICNWYQLIFYGCKLSKGESLLKVVLLMNSCISYFRVSDALGSAGQVAVTVSSADVGDAAAAAG